jgi:hypothetical protein
VYLPRKLLYIRKLPMRRICIGFALLKQKKAIIGGKNAAINQQQ